MNSHTHQTAPTQFIEANGVRLAYRRFGNNQGIPLVLFQHFIGTMDNWDPAVTDGLAREREVILFDNAGVASSAGEPASTIEGMAEHAIALITALHLSKVDLFGFSTGSLVAQQVAAERPDLVRRLVLEGSAPRGGVHMATFTPEFEAMIAQKRDDPETLWIDSLFGQSEASQAAGRDYVVRKNARTVDRDIDVSDRVAPAQTAAIARWGAPHADSNAYLKAIKQPVLVVAGSNDPVFYTINAYNLQQNLPDAQLIIYPDSGHAPMNQYPARFVAHVSQFLN